jgi:hypothetical protein
VSGESGVTGPATRTVAAVRRQAAVALVGVGAFLAALALLMHTYVHGELVRHPAQADIDIALQAEDATYLDTTSWEVVEDAEVTRSTEGVVGASPGDANRIIWQLRTVTTAGDRPLDHVDRRVITDRDTGSTVNCCGEHIDGDREVRQAGLVLWWPPGAEARDHPFYDPDIHAAPHMHYDGEDEIAGVETRRYVQQVADTQITDSTRQVPGWVLDRGEGTVEAERWLDVERTLWIEPRTGFPVHAAEERRETLRASDGAGEVVWLEADLELPGAHIETLAAQAQAQADLLNTVRTRVPVVLAVVGPLLIAAGVVIALRTARRRPALTAGERSDPDEPAEPHRARAAGNPYLDTGEAAAPAEPSMAPEEHSASPGARSASSGGGRAYLGEDGARRPQLSGDAEPREGST